MRVKANIAKTILAEFNSRVASIKLLIWDFLTLI